MRKQRFITLKIPIGIKSAWHFRIRSTIIRYMNKSEKKLYSSLIYFHWNCHLTSLKINYFCTNFAQNLPVLREIFLKTGDRWENSVKSGRSPDLRLSIVGSFWHVWRLFPSRYILKMVALKQCQYLWMNNDMSIILGQKCNLFYSTTCDENSSWFQVDLVFDPFIRFITIRPITH